MDREFVSPFFVPFNDPEIEEFACVDDVVFIAQLFLEVRDFVPGISGDDAVYQSAGERIGCIDPVGELLAQVPFLGVLEDDAF